jgi:hypothetical protein
MPAGIGEAPALPGAPVDALLAGELLGDEERLAEESLYLAGATCGQLVLFAQLRR